MWNVLTPILVKIGAWLLGWLLPGPAAKSVGDAQAQAQAQAQVQTEARIAQAEADAPAGKAAIVDALKRGAF